MLLHDVTVTWCHYDSIAEWCQCDIIQEITNYFGDGMSEKQVRDYDKFMLRLPEGMRDAIADRAQSNGRSMNSEIVQIIEDALASNEKGSQGLDLTGVSENQMEYIIEVISKKLVDKVGEALAAENKKPT